MMEIRWKRKIIRHSVFIGFLGAVLVSTYLLHIHRDALIKDREVSSCMKQAAPLFCYIDTARSLMKEGGAEEGLSYVTTVVSVEANYQIVHLVLHIVGQAAYLQMGSIEGALALLSSHTTTSHGFDFMLDGYRHGVYQAFLKGKLGNMQESAQRVQGICSDYLSIASDATLDRDTRSAADQCFHGMGHALMYAADNTIATAAAYCSELPYSWMRHYCFYGMFMEYTYTAWDKWEPETPRSKWGDMFELCKSVPEEERDACSRLVGRGFMNQHPGDLQGALEQCLLLESKFQEGCVLETAAVAIPAVFKDNMPSMINACKELAGGFEGTCIYGVASGIKQGSGGLSSEDQNFCTFVEERFQERCFSATGREDTVFFR